MSPPEKGTPEYALWVAAIDVAIYAPVKGSAHTVRISRKRIEALRTALEDLGIDWAKAKRMDDG